MLFPGATGFAQISPTNPYCNVNYTSGQCNQPGVSNAPGNGINDFINDFITCGGNQDITNGNSGCNGQPNNYIYYGAAHTMIAAPGQTIVCKLRSGITFAQGFAIFIDWNNNTIFDMPTENVAVTAAVPAANTWTTLTFVIPPGTPSGTYRLRVRCSFVVSSPPPCGTQTFGETEDYDLTIVQTSLPQNITATVSSNSPICYGQTLSLSCIPSVSTPSIIWKGPNSFTSNISHPVIANASPSLNGVYSVTVGTGNCPFIGSTTVVVAPDPTFSVNPTTQTVCQGGGSTASVVLTPGNSPLNYLYNWYPLGAGVFNPNAQITMINPPLLPVSQTTGTTIYTVVVSPTIMPSCATTRTLSMTIYNPLTPTLNLPAPVCNITMPINLQAVPGGGTWSANTAVTPGGFFDPAIASIGASMVKYSVSAGTCIVSNTGQLHVAYFNTSALTSSLGLKCVQDAPVNLMNIVQTTVNGTWSGPAVSGNMFVPAGLATGNYTLNYNTTSTYIGSVCPSSTVLVVPVFNPPVPVIAPIRPQCSTWPAFSLTANPSGGIWTTNPGVSIGGVLTPSLAQSNTNSVVYTAGIGTCVASSTANFIVSQFRPATLSGTIANLCATVNPVDLMGIVQNTTGSWSGQNVLNTGSSYSFNPANLPTGIYKLIYSTTPTPYNSQCIDTSMIAVSVLNPPVPVISQNGPYCNVDAPLQLNVTPNTGYWTNFAYVSPTGVLTPSLCSVGANMVQYVIGTNTCNTNHTKYIKVEAFEPAKIVGHVPDLCNTSPPMSLLPITLSNLGSWSGTGMLGSNFVPSVAGSGTHLLVHHTASSPSGLCPDKDMISVKVFSLALPSVSPAGPFCNNMGAKLLEVSPVGGVFGGSSGGAITAFGLFNPALASIGDNIVNYSVSAGPCIAYTQATIAVERFISAAFSTPQALSFCKGDKAVNMNTFVQNPGGKWMSPVMNGDMFDPSVSGSGVFEVVYQTQSWPTTLLCQDQSSTKITVNETPTVSVSQVSGGCAPLTVNLNAVPVDLSPVGKGIWYINDGKEELHGASVSHVFDVPGTYSMVVNYFTDKGCSTQVALKTPVTVYESPKADFLIEPQEITVTTPEVSLNNISTVLGNNSYVWTIQGQNQTYELNPKITFSQAGTYKVKLQATALNGVCKHEVTKLIEVKNDFNFFIPSAFSPNADGVNDYFLPVFSPYGLDVKTYEMEIFDRWGHLLFKTRDITQGWDGTLNNKSDNTLKQDAYVYKIRFKDNEARAYSKIGNVVLLPN